MKITALPILLSSLVAVSAFSPVPLPIGRPVTGLRMAVSVREAESSTLSDLSMKDLNTKIKDTFPEMSFIKRKSLTKNKMVQLLSTPAKASPKVKAGGKVEWAVEKGAKTFGLDLVQVPVPVETVSPTKPFAKAVSAFPGALTNKELIEMIDATLFESGFDRETTLVATSLCCDEVNRHLETDIQGVYTNNFNMGGLAGFPFGGAVSFGAMASHIPDGGSTIVVYGPHVGIDSKGTVGTVERRGRAKGGACCGSANAAAGYVSDVLNGIVERSPIPDDPLHAQQAYVGDMLLPYAERLEAAPEKMVELPYALYDAQSDMVDRIVQTSCSAVSDGKIAVVGGIQINTPPGFSDYFLPLSFELIDNKGNLIEDFMTNTNRPFNKVKEIFPGALSNAELITKVSETLADNGFTKEKTLLTTSLCCDEVNRPLGRDFSDMYGLRFNMGGLSGFPFGGAVSFGAMASHIPDGGSTIVVYGPHVGIDSKGTVGTVERRGRAKGGACCGSAAAAAGYVSSVLKGATPATLPDDVIDAQQYFVGKLLLPYAEQLEEAADKEVELPYALYGAQSELVARIIEAGASGVTDGQIAVIGGIQINTPSGFTDYYMPLSFDLYNNKGEKVKALWS
jgi:hypothetical protein